MPVVGFIGGIGAPELAIVLVIVLILFGAGRLPQVFEAFGKGVKSFRDAQKDEAIDAEGQRGRPAELADQDGLQDAHEVRQREKERR